MVDDTTLKGMATDTIQLRSISLEDAANRIIRLMCYISADRASSYIEGPEVKGNKKQLLSDIKNHIKSEFSTLKNNDQKIDFIVTTAKALEEIVKDTLMKGHQYGSIYNDSDDTGDYRGITKVDVSHVTLSLMRLPSHVETKTEAKASSPAAGAGSGESAISSPRAPSFFSPDISLSKIDAATQKLKEDFEENAKESKTRSVPAKKA